MAVADTVLLENTNDTIALLSGQFSTTVHASVDVTSVDSLPRDVSSFGEGNDTQIMGETNAKMYSLSGQFSTTIKTSALTSPYTSLRGISFDSTNTMWTKLNTDKLMENTGQMTTTINTSLDVSAIDTNPASCDATDTDIMWGGWEADILFLQSGKFTSTVKSSANMNATDTALIGSTTDKINTPWAGASTDKMYLNSGVVTTTIKTSLVHSRGNSHGISVNDKDARLGGAAAVIDFFSLTLTGVGR